MSTVHSINRIKIANQILLVVQKFEKSTLQCFIVYGSTAQGTATEQSDLDIQILVNVTTNQFVSHLEKVKNVFEQKYNLEIAINIKTVTQFLENLIRKEPLYFFILADGICQLNSTVFKGLKHFLKASPKPIQASLEKVHSQGIQIRSAAILKTVMPEFIAEFENLLDDFIKLQFLQKNPILQYLELFSKTQASRELHLPKSISAFNISIANIENFKNNSYNLSASSEFSLIDILKILNIILQNTNEIIHE